MTEILVWRLVGDGGAVLWSDREGEHRLHWILVEAGTEVSGGQWWRRSSGLGGDQQRWEVREREVGERRRRGDAGGSGVIEREKILIKN